MILKNLERRFVRKNFIGYENITTDHTLYDNDIEMKTTQEKTLLKMLNKNKYKKEKKTDAIIC